MKTTIKELDFQEILKAIDALPTDLLLFIVDEKVWDLYQHKFSFEGLFKGKKVLLWKSAEGENAKTISSFEKCTEFFLEKEIHRNAHLIAVGGGATSDFAGFVASTLLRGIPWSVVPTTLLAMIDASIGGKVSINSVCGKNLIGAFHGPQNIWMDHNFLETLPEIEMLSGKGEMIKYALLDKGINKAVTKKTPMNKMIGICSKYKLGITERDFRDTGVRKILNLGHTLGHALEKAYGIPHGIAVVHGMEMLFKAFYQQENIDELSSLKKCFDWNGDQFLSECEFSKIKYYLSKDKKIASTESIDLVLLKSVGVHTIEKMPLAQFVERLEQ